MTVHVGYSTAAPPAHTNAACGSPHIAATVWPASIFILKLVLSHVYLIFLCKLELGIAYSSILPPFETPH